MLPLVLVLVAGLALIAVGDVFAFRSARSSGGETLMTEAPVLVATGEHAPERAPARGRRSNPSLLVFLACSALYLVVGAYVVLHRGGIVGDAAARVAQAWYVVGSRDPHLAAIGFVWNPLPSVAAIPLVMLRGIWPALTERMFAGVFVSALCMAGAVVQLRGLLRDIGSSYWLMTIVTACFALNPMVIIYGANGMSEAMYLLFLIGTVRYLIAWTVSGRLRPLVLTGLNLALAFLTRYETLAAAIGVIAVVLLVGVIARDASKSRRERLAEASADALIVGVPVATAFISWVIVSWIITGEPFMQFTSRYGNTSILEAAGGAGDVNGTGWPKIVLAAVQTVAYIPWVLPLTVVAVIVALLRRDRRFLALAAIAAPLAFSVMSYASGSTFGWFRYYIPVLPLALIALALLLNPMRGMRPETPKWLRAGAPAAIAVVLVVGLSGIVSTALAITSTRIAPDERATLAWLFRSPQSPAEDRSATMLSSSTTIARDIDALGLAAGSVALDTFDCGPLIVLASRHPHQFVISSDRDFERVVADPAAFDVPYVLVPDGDQGIEAISLVHPGIYAGGEIGTLRTKVIDEYDTPGCPTYRLIRVIGDGS